MGRGGYPLCHGAGTEVVKSCVGGGEWGGATPGVMELALRWWILCRGGVEWGGGATPCVMELALRGWSPL